MSAQLPVAKWHVIFEDATVADVVLDKLVNNAHRIELKGPSLRPHNPQNDGGGSASEYSMLNSRREVPWPDKIRMLAGHRKNGVRILLEWLAGWHRNAGLN